MPTTATPRTSPVALPEDADPFTVDLVDRAPTGTWAAELAAAPTTVAWRAAVRWGARLVEAGTCGETGDAWFYSAERREWMHDDGYTVTPVADEAGITETDAGDPRRLEVLDWRDNDYRAQTLAAWFDAQLELRYVELAALAGRRGQAEAFRAAVDALMASDPYALDGGLHARLAGRDVSELVPDGEREVEGDEDDAYPYDR